VESGCCLVTTLGKLFTHIPLSRSSIIWYQSKTNCLEPGISSGAPMLVIKYGYLYLLPLLLLLCFLLQVTVDKIYSVLLFVNGGWMVDVRTVSNLLPYFVISKMLASFRNFQ